MSIGSCTSCSPVLDATKLAANPKADTNKDGKVTAAELQNANLDPASDKNADLKTDATKDLLKVNTDTKADPYIASKNPSLTNSGSFLLLAENNQ